MTTSHLINHTVHIDTIPPTVDISNVPDIEKNEAFDVTITFSEPVNGFVAGDIELTGPATLALKEGADGDSIYKVTITPNPSSEGDVIFRVRAAVIKDFALNGNTASDSHTVQYRHNPSDCQYIQCSRYREE